MMRRSSSLYALVVLLAVAADQLVKFLVVSGMGFHQEIRLLPVLSLFRTANTGIAFSMLPWLGDYGLIVLMLVVIAFVLWLWWTSDPARVIMRLGFALVIGGALGNLIDRIVRGHVVDYVLFHVGSWSFAIFNLADSFITIGAGLVILDEVLTMWRGHGSGAPSGRDGKSSGGD